MRKTEKMEQMTSAVMLLVSAVQTLSEKVDNCNGMCECILDEVTPLGLDLEKLMKSAPVTMD